MAKRAWLVLVLGAITLAIQGLSMYQAFFRPGPGIVWQMDVSYTIQKSYLVAAAVKPTDDNGQPSLGARAGLRAKDRIITVYDPDGGGWPIHGMADFGAAINRLRYNAPWQMAVSRETRPGVWQEIRLQVPPLDPETISSTSTWGMAALGLGVPLLAVCTALFIGLMKAENDNAFLASLLFMSFTSIFELYIFTFPPVILDLAVLFHQTLNTFLIYLFARFFLRFPSPSLIDRKAPWLKRVFLLFTLVEWPVGVAMTLQSYHSFVLRDQLEQVVSRFSWFFTGMALLMFLTGIVSLVLNTFMAETKDERRRMAILLTGTAVSLFPLLAFIIYNALTDRRPPFWLLAILIGLLAIFPLSFVYVVIKHRVLGIRLILRRGLRYALVSRGFLAFEAVAIFLFFFLVAGPVTGRLLHASNRLTVGLLTAVLTLGIVAGIRRVNRSVMPAIDRRFFREAYDAQRILSDLGRATRQLVTQPDRLLHLMADKISDSLHPDQVAIFLRGGLMMQLAGAGDRPAGGAIPLPAAPGNSLFCFHHRVRAGLRDDILSTPQFVSQLALPEESVIARYLDRTAIADPDPQDVYFDDPRSWTGALVQADSPAGSRLPEKALLERLNTRLIVPLVTNDRLLGFLSLGEKLSEEPYASEDKELLSTVAQQAAIALDYAQLIREVAQQEKLKRELEIAREVQAKLFPQTQPVLQTLDYTGFCQTAREVGGDYYDFLPLGPDKLALALGDVSGKGISAALLMASLQAMLRSQAPLRGMAVDALVTDINRLMNASTDGSKYATFFLGVYDDANRAFTYVNAGHNPPLLLRRIGTAPEALPAAPPDSQPPAHALQPLPHHLETTLLDAGGLAVGMLPDSAYRQETIQLQPGDLLVMYTDGVTEAQNAQGDEFGENRLLALVAGNLRLTPAALKDAILAANAEFVGSAPQYDDLTLLIARVK